MRTTKGTCTHVLEIGAMCHQLLVEVDYTCYPSEPMIRYYHGGNGDGHPGTPSFAEWEAVRVIEWEGHDLDRDHWIYPLLDEIATREVDDHFEPVEESIFDDANQYEPQYEGEWKDEH